MKSQKRPFTVEVKTTRKRAAAGPTSLNDLSGGEPGAAETERAGSTPDPGASPALSEGLRLAAQVFGRPAPAASPVQQDTRSDAEEPAPDLGGVEEPRRQRVLPDLRAPAAPAPASQDAADRAEDEAGADEPRKAVRTRRAVRRTSAPRQPWADITSADEAERLLEEFTRSPAQPARPESAPPPAPPVERVRVREAGPKLPRGERWKARRLPRRLATRIARTPRPA